MAETPPTRAQLDGIEKRAAHLHQYGTLTDGPLQADLDQLAGQDVPALLAEIRRLREELENTNDHVNWLERNTLADLQRQVQHHRDGKQRWRNRAEKAEARVRELERPAIEAKRNEIRDSFAELAAACRETKDYEGAFDAECRLREREEQWKREDEAAVR
jgi:hypothetical protein